MVNRIPDDIPLVHIGNATPSMVQEVRRVIRESRIRVRDACRAAAREAGAQGNLAEQERWGMMALEIDLSLDD